MEAHQVVPEIIDTVPAHVATVKYAPGVEMNLGKELTPAQVKDAPTEVTFPAEPNALYTVLFTDPDAPSRANPLYREILHWLVVNVPGNDLSKGTTAADYAGSGPPEGTGLHRYVLTVYKQPGSLSADLFASFKIREGRFKFSTKDFIAKHKLGKPIAGNFYQAQTDDYLRARHAEAVASALKTHELIPDILDQAPEYSLSVLYSSGASLHAHNSGNELTPTAVKDVPSLIAWKADLNALYTVIFTDACNKTTKDKHGEILHWLVVNVPGTDVSKGDTFDEYLGSGPPKEVGLHRYVFLVFKQQGKLSLSRPKVRNTSIEGRVGFNTRNFAKENNLGTPLAGNFYLAQYDDYVPILHKQLGSPKV